MSEREEKAPGYMTFREAAIMLSLMPDNDAAAAIKATTNYFLYGTVANLSGSAEQVFNIMKADIDRNNTKYQKIVERNKNNRIKGWEKNKG